MKKVLSFLICLVIAFSAVTYSFAATGNVTYDGEAQNIIFAPGGKYSLTDLFPDFKGVMPGDSITQKITVKNDASDEVKVKIYLRSKGADVESHEFLSQLRLRVKASNNNTMAYMFDAAASETAQLTDWVYLGTLYSGGQVNLDVTLDVPVTMGDEFQEQVGYLQWEFMIEEYPVDPDDPMVPTGDTTRQIWFVMLFVSAFALLMLILREKKARK